MAFERILLGAEHTVALVSALECFLALLRWLTSPFGRKDSQTRVFVGQFSFKRASVYRIVECVLLNVPRRLDGVFELLSHRVEVFGEPGLDPSWVGG